MGNDSTTAFRTREQLVKFPGMFSPRFSKPAREFIGEMLFGIQASQDTLLSEIGRSLQEDIRLKKTEERLCRHLAKPGMDERIHQSIVEDAASMIRDDTPIMIDSTDIQKACAEKMPHLAKGLGRQRRRGGRKQGLHRVHGGRVRERMPEDPSAASAPLVGRGTKVHDVRVQYGSLPVRLPEHPKTLLHLVVVKWPKGDRRMMLPTTEKAVRTREAPWEVVQGCLTRWRIEETIRRVKQSYHLEHMRFLDCQRLKDMAALVAAVAHFAERLERSGNRRSPRGSDGSRSSASSPGTLPRCLVACSKSPSSSTTPSRTA